MGIFERFLTLWVALCIVAGVVLGEAAPGIFHAIGDATIAQVNLPVATVDGGPVGLSILGAAGTDRMLLELAQAFAKA